jgi:hypothetical protein
LLGQRLNRDRLRSLDAAQDSPAPVQTTYSRQMLRSESLNGDRARAALRWEQGKVQRKRTLKAPVQSVSVIPPAQQTALA